jgi:hypothetical protein
MRTGMALVLGAGLLALYSGVAAASERSRAACCEAHAAAVHHQVRHSRALHYRRTVSARSYGSSMAAAPRSETSNLMTTGNNPARNAAIRQANERAVTSPTLVQSGNNPAKRYGARQLPQNAAKDQTLMTNGNNPARKAAARTSANETVGAGSSERRRSQ